MISIIKKLAKECAFQIVKTYSDDSTTDWTIFLKHHFTGKSWISYLTPLIQITCINCFNINRKMFDVKEREFNGPYLIPVPVCSWFHWQTLIISSYSDGGSFYISDVKRKTFTYLLYKIRTFTKISFILKDKSPVSVFKMAYLGGGEKQYSKQFIDATNKYYSKCFKTFYCKKETKTKICAHKTWFKISSPLKFLR